MPTYSIQGPDGKTYSIDGPEGATRDQVIAKIKEKTPSLSEQPAQEPQSELRKFAGGAAEAISEAPVAGPRLIGAVGSYLEPKIESAVGYFSPSKAKEMHETAAARDAAFADQPEQRGVLGTLPDVISTEKGPSRTVGEFVGNPVSYFGPGSAASKVLTATTGALGSEVLGDLAKDYGYETEGRIVGGILGGGVGGVGNYERAAVKLSNALPTTQQIKASATAAYDAIKNARLKAQPWAVEALGSDISNSLDADLIVPNSAPRTYHAIKQMQEAGGDVAQIMAIREKLRKIKPSEGTDYAAASHAIDSIDSFVENLQPQQVISGDPKLTAALLDHARSSWKSYKQVDLIEKAADKAERQASRSGTGANEINTTRQRIDSILNSEKQSRGFSDEAKEQMRRIVLGTWATNKARYASKYAPSGTISTGFSILAGEATSPGVGVAVATTGLIGRYLGEYLTQRQVRELEDIVRAESPIGRAAKAANQPALQQAKEDIPAAAARGGAVAALSSPLAPGN